MPSVTHVLVVANRTAATPALLAAVRARAESSPCRFYLVVPATPKGLHRIVDPEDSGHDAAAENLQLALPVLSDAAGSPVEGHVGDANPLSAITDAVHQRQVDEILISTLPARVSRWLHVDLVSKARALGLPVEHVAVTASATAAA